jgi:hypothetical protein
MGTVARSVPMAVTLNRTIQTPAATADLPAGERDVRLIRRLDFIFEGREERFVSTADHQAKGKDANLTQQASTTLLALDEG